MDYFKLLEQFSKASDLPISIFDHGNLIFKGHSDKRDYSIPMFLKESLPSNLPDIWVSHIPENLFFGGISLRQQRQLLILGPVSAHECSIGQCELILRRLGYKKQEAGTFQKIINDFALCDISHLRNYLRFLNHILNEVEDVEIPDIDFKWKNIFSASEEYSIEIPSETDGDEEEILNAFIRNGKVKELENYLHEVLFRMNNPVDKGIRNINQQRNYVIGANIVMSRIAIHAGADAQMVKNLTGYYLELLTRVNNLADLNRIFYKLAVDYTKKVKSIQDFVSEDMLARRVNSYVQAHLYEKLSTSVIAEALHMNEAYLCMEFKKSTGQTITGFIQECKIREAKFLLEKGHYPTEISDVLEFSSPSYFGVVFKKITGMTPTEYQKSID